MSKAMNPTAAEPKKRQRKSKVVAPAAAVLITDAEEAALLAPVDMPVHASVINEVVAVAAAAVAAVAVAAVAEPTDASNTLHTHSSRLQSIEHTRCVARTHGGEVAGTKPSDAGSNGKFYHEKQCIRKPVPGSELCIGCAEKEKKYNVSKEGRWYGRLTQPMLEKSYVVGCDWFWNKYPNGIPSDPTTQPSQVSVATPAPAAAPAAAPAPKKNRGRPKKDAVTAAELPAEVPAEAPAVQEKRKGRPKKVAPTEAPAPAQAVAADTEPIALRWMCFMDDGTQYVRNPITHNVYYIDVTEEEPDKQIMRNRFVGRWQAETSTIDRYASEQEDDD